MALSPGKRSLQCSMSRKSALADKPQLKRGKDGDRNANRGKMMRPRMMVRNALAMRMKIAPTRSTDVHYNLVIVIRSPNM